MLKLRNDREAHLWEKTVHQYAEQGLSMADAIQQADAYIVARRERYAADGTSPDRWEVGFRNIVTFVLGPRGASFEIADVVERVRELAGCDANGDPIPGVGGPRDMANARALLIDWLDYAEDDDPRRPLLVATREWLERAGEHARPDDSAADHANAMPKKIECLESGPYVPAPTLTRKRAPITNTGQPE